MTVPAWTWAGTVLGIFTLAAVQGVILLRRPSITTRSEAGRWFVFYMSCVATYAAGVALFAGGYYGVEFFEEYATEGVLAFELVFILTVLLVNFSVPRIYERRALLLGMGIAILLRGVLLLISATLAALFAWVLYLSGLLYFARAALASAEIRHDNEGRSPGRRRLHALRRLLGVADSYHGGRLFVRLDGRLLMTPMFVVVIVIATSDLLVVPDTTDPFIIFTANSFVLLSVPALFTLINENEKVARLIRPGIGFVAIFGILGVKLLLQAFAQSGVHKIGPIAVAPFSAGYTAAAVAAIVVATVLVRLIQERRASDAEDRS